MNKRVLKLRHLFDANKVDAVLITQAENRRYLSGFHGTAGYLFITPKKAVLATDFRYTEQAAGEAPDFEILHIGSALADWLPGLVRDSGINKLGFEVNDVTYAFFHQIRTTLRKKGVSTGLVPVSGMVESVRSIKEPVEIEYIRQASSITDRALEEVAAIIKAGMTERQIAWALEKTMREKGSQALPFEIIVGSGPNAALPHARPSDRVIQDGEPIVIDMGAKVSGYASDLTRTVYAGKPGVKFKEIYEIVLEAQQSAVTSIEAGMTGHEADSIARKVIDKAGYGDAFGHSLGHGVGLQEHEAPRLGPNSKDILSDNMIFTIEPGIYLSGWGGVRIEDTVAMVKGKVIPVTDAIKIRF